MTIFKTLLCFCLILLWISMVSSESPPPSAYDMLEKFNFPKGILPEGVKGYVLHDDNRFEVYLDRDCQFQVEEGGYYLHYKKKISGSVRFGSLRDLQGVSVKVMFIWWGISEVSNRGDGKLGFYVGPMSASFPISNFEDNPQCGLGINPITDKLVSDS